jgi:cell division protein FtsZ
MRFDIPKEQSSIIKVIGVGGGGSNAVNHMYEQGIKGVDFIVCNTDQQALDVSPVPIKVQLGPSLTEGRGAGSIPEIGKNAAIENIDDIREMLQQETKMVFVTAGMGGGTGTGAAPIIAQTAREMGILTVGIVTIPFQFEGRKRKQQAEEGLEAMRDAVDTLLVINNDRLREMFGNLSLKTAFEYADNVLSTAAKGIAEVISVTGQINVDFNDVNTVMKNSGVAIMGQSNAEGEDRAIMSVRQALESPLLNDNDIKGAQYILLNITYGDKEVLMDEISDITDYIQDAAGSTADVIWGHGYDETLGDSLSVTLIATGFQRSPDTGVPVQETRNVMNLEDNVPTMITQPITNPIAAKKPAQPTAPKSDEPFLVKRNLEEAKESKTEEPVAKNWNTESKEATEQETNHKAEAQDQTDLFSQNEPSEPQERIVYSLDDTYGEEPVKNEEPTNSSGSWEQLPEKNEPSKEWSGLVQNDQSVPSTEENQDRAQERINRIREISARLKSPNGISDLENEPAFKRRNVQLDDTPHSSENNVSRYTISEDKTNEDDRPGLRDNNSFLHDNVD